MLKSKICNKRLPRVLMQLRTMSEKVSSQTTQNLNNPRHVPSEFDIRVLLWSKTFKTREEIPKLVAYDIIANAQSKCRIKMANIAMVLTVVGCIVAIYSGKNAAKRGESVHQMNMDWHQHYNEKNPIKDSK